MYYYAMPMCNIYTFNDVLYIRAKSFRRGTVPVDARGNRSLRQ